MAETVAYYSPDTGELETPLEFVCPPGTRLMAKDEPEPHGRVVVVIRKNGLETRMLLPDGVTRRRDDLPGGGRRHVFVAGEVTG